MVYIELSQEGREGPLTYASNQHPVDKMSETYVETYLGCDIYYLTPPTVSTAQYQSPCIVGGYIKKSAVKKRICQGQGGIWDGSSCSFEEPEPSPEAKGSIVSYTPPGSTRPGDTVSVSVTAKNIGTGSGIFMLQLIDRDENTIIDSTGWFTLAEGGSATKTLTGTMPDRDWNLKITLERQIPTGAVTVDEKNLTAVNTVNWWTTIKTRWNNLTRWQKTLMVTGTTGGLIAGASLYKTKKAP